MDINIIKDDTNSPVAGIVSNGEIFTDYTPPSWDEWFMGMVYDTARKSKDTSTKIGAVIVRDQRPILFGYNGIPRNVKDSPERMKRPLKYRWTEHAERNAIYCGARFGIATDGTTMFTQSIPCMDCARGIVNSGIKKIVIHKQTEDIFKNHPQWATDCIMSQEMFAEANIEIVILNKPVGKWSYVDGKVYVV